jgi:hypothetical protein
MQQGTSKALPRYPGGQRHHQELMSLLAAAPGLQANSELQAAYAEKQTRRGHRYPPGAANLKAAAPRTRLASREWRENPYYDT